jgi:O-succinylbenzoic acid--CoA ligase
MHAAVGVFPDWLASRARTNADRIALSADGRTWTFEELDADVTKLARKLAGLGVGEGERLATLLHNGALPAMLAHAALRLGATLVPLNVRLSRGEIEWQLGDVSPALLITDERTRSIAIESDVKVIDETDLALVPEADAVLRSEHPSDSVLAVIYTSGTTGTPKGAMLTVANFWWNAIGSALNLGTQEHDRWIVCLPMFHVGGLSIIMRSAIYGTTAVVQDGFDAARVNEEIDDRNATLVSVVSVMLERMIADRNSRPYPPSLRCVLLGGGSAPLPLLELCTSLGIPVVQTYGLTETCSQAVTLSPADSQRRLGSAGKALYPNDVRIDATEAEEGEILVRGPIVTPGYFQRPDATERIIVDGWLHTGDIGRLDADGFLYVLDRRDDLIVTGGENVYPAEVEAALLAHESVVEAGVIGVADETWGQRVVAIVKTNAQVDAQKLDAHCRTLLAGYKTPREFRFVNDPLPRTASGKIRRGVLRDSLADLS